MFHLRNFASKPGQSSKMSTAFDGGGWATRPRLAGFDKQTAGPDNEKLGRAIGRMPHIDDLETLLQLVAA
jgi:hypothetical protein